MPRRALETSRAEQGKGMTTGSARILSRIGALILVGLASSNLFTGSVPPGDFLKALLVLALVVFAVYPVTRNLRITRLSPIFVVAAVPGTLDPHSVRIESYVLLLALIALPVIAIASARAVFPPRLLTVAVCVRLLGCALSLTSAAKTSPVGQALVGALAIIGFLTMLGAIVILTMDTLDEPKARPD